MKPKTWHEISNGTAYKLSVAEFKGMTIQALQDIRVDIIEIKGKVEAIDTRTIANQNDISKAKGYAMGLGAVAGFLTSLFKDNFFK